MNHMKIVFVYNADSGRINALLDIAHKAIRPQTYACSLCALTHDLLSEKQAWKSFRDRTPFDLAFYHKDEFEKTHDLRFDYPVILRQTDRFEPLVTAEQIGAIACVDALIDRIEQAAADPRHVATP